MKDDISQEIRGGTTFSVYTNVTSCLSAKKKKKKIKDDLIAQKYT